MFDYNILRSDNYLVLDLETTNYMKGDAVYENNLLLAVWEYNGKRKHKWGGIYEQSELVNDANKADIIVAHNVKFELKWLRECGLDLSKVYVYCTQIGEYVLAGNRSIMSRLGLGKVAPKYGAGVKDKYIDNMMKSGKCPSELPKSLVLKRCIKDVIQCRTVFKKQRERIIKAGLLPVMHTRCVLTPCLADIEFNGLKLDPDRVIPEYNRVTEELDDVTKEINKFTGGINPNSPKQMCQFLYQELGFKPLKDKAGNDIISASSDTLQALKPKNKRQREFLELKKRQGKLNALLTKSLRSFKTCIDDNALLTAQFNQTVTKTHRLSSSGTLYKVQFQNLPRVYKPMFKARHPGWKVGEIDGAQLEFRVAAFVAQDPVAFHDIINDEDVHQYTADVMTAAGRETSRQEAKADTFKPLFGGKSGSPAQREYYKAFQEKYKKISTTQHEWLMEALTHKKRRLESGLITYWPECKRTRTGYVEGTTQVYNLPIQSLATAEIIPVAVTALWLELKRRGLKSFVTNTIHDSAILEIHPDEVLEVQDIAVKAFTETVYEYLYKVYNLKFNIPLGAGLKIGDNWSEADLELSKFVYSNGTYRNCVNDDGGELKYTPECPFDFNEAA